jgi:hypothetical protein
MVSYCRRRILIGGTALPFAGLLGACAGNPRHEKVAVNEVIAPRAPPPLMYEPVPPMPMGRDEIAVWTPGYWRWDGRDYVWTPGVYANRPRREAYWIPARWEQRGNTWVYIEGRWG